MSSTARMKSTLLMVAVAAALGTPAIAGAQTAADYQQQIQELRTRLETLEKTMKESEEAQSKLTDTVAQVKDTTKKVDWASKITWKGDLRYRHENIDAEAVPAVPDQTRHRIRARFGMTAKVNDTISGTVQLATNGGNGDPRSTNQTLGSGWDRKGVAIDLAYIDWTPLGGLNLQLGKMPQPFQKVASFFWDGDITPEGAALKFSKGAFFGSAFGFWLQESGNSSDANLVGGQLGVRTDFGGVKLLGAVGYYDVGAVQGEITTTAGACTANNAFFGGPQGNSTVTQAGCARLLNDYNMYEVLGQAEFALGSLPLVVFADYMRNADADDFDTAFAGGFTLGRASNPGTWEFGYVYQKTEKDAVFGQFVDSDFGGGITDVKGSAIRFGYAPARNWTLNGTYFFNDRFIDVGTDRSYDRLQLDFNVRY